MNYDNAVNYLYGLQKHGIKLGLDNITKLLFSLGNPEKSFRAVHVAGTNGKGSTSAMTASILQAAGFRAGLFTSPHLISFTERIRINNEQITEQEVVDLTDEIRTAIQKSNLLLQPSAKERSKRGVMNSELSPTFFEFVTAIGFLYFKRKDVDWAVVETGMGGRLDATNVLKPEVSIVTNINYDHKEFLGSTLTEIAREKAGIIKEGAPVVCAAQQKEAEDVIYKTALERSAPLFIYGKDFNCALKSSSHNGIVFDYSDDAYEIKDLFVPLAGKHQVFNACLAVKAAMLVLQKAENKKIRNREVKNSQHLNLSTSQLLNIKNGLSNVSWPGRLEFISHNPSILIDGAHNPDAAVVLSDALRENFLPVYKRIILIMGIMSDKDMQGIMKPLLPLASEIIMTAPSYERAASPQRLAEYALSFGYSNVHIANTVKDAIEKAISESQGLRVSESLIVITGSFYTIGEAKEVFGEKGILSRLRE